MNTEQAIEFLASHQPMPPDGELQPSMALLYNEARKALQLQQVPQAIPLLLNSFGDGIGKGFYQLVETTLRAYDGREIIRHLAEALRSPHPGVRWWSAQIAVDYPSETLVAPLGLLLRDEREGTRFAAVAALEQVGSEEAYSLLRASLDTETSEDVRDLMTTILAGG